MIIVLKPRADQHQLENLTHWLTEKGIEVHTGIHISVEIFLVAFYVGVDFSFLVTE